MPDQLYINASSLISQQVVYKDRRPVFSDQGSDLQGFLRSAYQGLQVNYPKFYKMDNLSKLGWLCAEWLLRDHFSGEVYRPQDVGVVLSNANASLDTDIRYFESTRQFASPALFVYTLPNIVIGEICIRHHFQGENAFFIFEHFDANFIEQYVGNLVNNNILQACICGWVDCLGDGYKAALFLVEKKPGPQAMEFTAENILTIYHSDNG